MSLTTFLTEEASTEEARSRCLKIDVSVILAFGYTSQISLWYENLLPYLIRKHANFWYNKLGFKSSFNFLNKKLQKKKMKMEQMIHILFSSKNSAFLSLCFSQNWQKTKKPLSS